MISTTSIEPSNPVNADLSWKVVKKGSRSATRRPRKINQSFNISRQYIDKGFEEEPSVAESEELGLAVFRHHSSENIDHLPIKKRRSVQKSPPLPCHVPFDEWFGEAGVLVDNLVPVKTSMPSDKSLANKKPPCSEDLYGIELLAAAACNASLSDDFFNVNEVKVEKNFEATPQTNASISVTSLEETIAAIACNTSISDNKFNVKVVKVKEKSEVLPQSDASINVMSVEENIINSHKQNSLLKDINSVAYDSREQNNSLAVSGNIRDIKAWKGSSLKKNVRLHWDLNTIMDDRELPSDNMNTDSPIHDSVDVHSLLTGEIEKLEASAQPACEPLNGPSKVEASGCIGPKSNSILGESPSEELMNSPTKKMREKVVEDRSLGFDLQLGQMLAVEKVQLKRQDDATMVDSTISEISVCDMIRINLSGTTLNVEGPCKLEKSAPLMGKGGDLVEKIDNYVPLGVDPRVGSSSEVEFNKLALNSCKRSGEAVLEDSLDDGDVSDYSPGGHYHFARIDKMPHKYQSGCESPVEDGEFRESIVYSWQENEEERDCVDYDMDDRDASDDFSVVNHSVSKAGSSSNRIDSNEKMTEKVSSGRKHFAKELNRSVTTRKLSGWDQIPIGCERVAKTIEANDRKLAGVGAFDSTQKLDGKGSLEEKMGSRPIRGNFSTLLLRLSGSGAFDVKGTRDGQIAKKSTRDGPRGSGACFNDGHVYRFDKYLGRERFISRMHDESQKNSHDGDVSRNWDSRNNYQDGYRRGGSNTRLRSSNIPDGDDDLAHDNHRHPYGNYSRGGYRPFVWRRSPDDHNSPKLGNFSTRDDSHYRSRGGSGIYRRGFVKGNRDDFHDPVTDHSDRRKYSNTPVYNGDNSFSRPRKSPSRSRSRSPIPWHLQRQRDGGRRQISRSPDFRSKSKIGGNRVHQEDSKFSENENGFLSLPRKGYFNDRNSNATCYKNRDSPGRFFGQRQKFGLKTDDGGFRPRLNPDRFSKVNNNSSYEGDNNERMRYNNNKHEMIHQVRHRETGGVDCLKKRYTRKEYTNNKNNSCIRGIEKSDELGNSWEEGKHRFRNVSEIIYTTSSKQSGLRDYVNEIPASRG